VEALGYHRLSERERRIIESLFSQLFRLPVSDATVSGAIHLRQQRKMSLGDALIAATALEHRLMLATANTDDFRWIAGLVLLNP
jgi:predicted nucleic acid-binding protein